jgi:hypothetical protein
MADITQLLANAADTKADFDFGKLNKSYWDGKDQFAKNELRDAFREGVPLGPDGQPDFAAMSKTLFQKGGLDQGLAASNLDVSRQQLAAGQRDRALYAGGGVGQPAPVLPRRLLTVALPLPVAPPLNRGGAQPAGQPAQPQGAPQGGTATLGQILTAQGIPNDQLGPQRITRASARPRGSERSHQHARPSGSQRARASHPAVEAGRRWSGSATAAPDCSGRSPAAAGPCYGPSRARFQFAVCAARPGQADAELARLRFLAGSTDKGTAEAARAELKIRLEGQQPTNTAMKEAAAMGIPRQRIARTAQTKTPRSAIS